MKHWTPAQVKEYIESIFTEKDRAIKMADDEREKAASALRVEQQRREDQATAERDKAAENLRIELARAIKEGDERLREHITNQIMQINAVLVSADKLEVERLSRADSDITALAEKLEVLRVAQSVAQDKFERSVESRFAQVNEFRSTLDDLGKTMATRREMETNVTTLQDLIEAARQERQHQIDDLRGGVDDKDKAMGARIDENQRQIGELRSRIDIGPAALRSVEARLDLATGRSAGIQLTTGTLATWIGLAIALATVVTWIVVHH